MKITFMFLLCICGYIAAVSALPPRKIKPPSIYGTNLQAYSEEVLDDSKELENEIVNIDEGSEDDFEIQPTLSRKKRQSVYHAMNLAANHNNHPVGRPYGQIDLNGSANNLRNYNAQAGVGIGSTLWRSPNDRHSLGAGVYAGQNFGRYEGFRYQSKPDVGVGLGYRFSF